LKLKSTRAHEIVFITHELTDERRALLREGLIDAIIDQNPEFEVLTAVEAMGRHFGRLEKQGASTVTPINIHMIENC
jgi:LacI family transcriptional regulator